MHPIMLPVVLLYPFLIVPLIVCDTMPPILLIILGPLAILLFPIAACTLMVLIVQSFRRLLGLKPVQFETTCNSDDSDVGPYMDVSHIHCRPWRYV